MSVVAFPPTPQKTPELSHGNRGVSTQILPLARFSSTGSTPPNSSQESTSSDTKSMQSPVKDKLQKLGKSIAEPLLQYFHDLQVSTDSEEPEILNTPKSVAQNATLSPSRSAEKAVISRNLFNTQTTKEYENLPPITITDM